MSSRHLRRVLASQEKKFTDDDQSLESSSDEQEEDVVKSSAFDLLLGSSEEDDDDEDEQGEKLDEDELSHESGKESEKKDKKTNTSNKGKSKEPMEDSSDEEFEAALKGLDRPDDLVKEETTTTSSSPLFLELLAPVSELMDPLSELKRKIGNFNPAAGGPADQRFAGLIERVQGKKRPTSLTLRKGRSQMVGVQASWPAVPASAIGLQLRVLSDAEDGEEEGYVIEHSPAYLQSLRTAVYLMRQGDIDSLVSLIHQSAPYQIDALLVISDYVRMSSADEAAELVEWCIHLMERCFAGTGGRPFSPFLSGGRGSLLVYEIPENRKMHLALFRHVQSLLRKGCYRAALEFCKVMLCLDLDDPLLVRPLMALAALKSQQYDWILKLHGEMAEWMVAGQQVDWDLTAALALFFLDRREEATALLTELLSKYPYIIPILLSEDSETTDGCVHVKAQMKIFALRLSPILKDRSVSAWLQSCLPSTKMKTIVSTSPWADPFDHAKIYRHALLSDLAGLNLPIPRSLTGGEMNVYDPIPPESIQATSSSSIVGSLAETLSRILRFNRP